MKRTVIKLGLVLAVAVAVWWFWPGEESSEAPQIEVTAVERGDITRIVSAVGSVRALNTVEVGSQLSGQIDQLLADFNTPVQAGDLLARIDPQTFERRVQEAEANLAVARANVSIQDAGIRKAEVALGNAEREYRRQQSLVERGLISASDLDQAEATFLSAQADLDIARAQKTNAEATVLQREAALDSARIDLERTEIRSPIDGVVIERAVDLGQTVAASLQAPLLFSIAQDLSEIQIEASVDEADIGSVREGAEASFTVDAFPDREFAGQVTQVRLAPLEEQNVVTYTVVINASNPGQRLLPGMTASIDIVTGVRENVLRVANAAVRFRAPEELIAADAGPGEGAARPDPGAQLAESLREMGVDEARLETIQNEMREAFGQLRGLFMSGADRETIRARIGEATREVMLRHLNDEEMAAFEALQRERESTRPATLYSLREDGLLQPRRVRLGIADDRYTELAAGDLSEGDEVVTRLPRTRDES
ncbi:efflux RND transporter periplasmic adaptor subunit [Wenzhouxiangella marina]|uniref:RND family efflux transporter MFP subunit n=1 Tax=Wenzhouxiangella marina TaxID=1579979 RepID=A0A0K0XS20_9GAMM|nr:efflux RND transporter periplasmic adaptor subunit [Wenzhouxiangella marina]AKS40488.1 RND family efflux transporter MFP subunit [Wenzhouxiangella marina]MBB6088190.1 HlyD family secretion protein [Wenzhouxiangella marina]